MSLLTRGNTPRHTVFVSYHHANDQIYRDYFERLFALHHEVMISKSVQIGEIDPYLKTETIRQKVRDEYLRDSTVTVVLVGSQTWQRKHVDWEIGSSIRQTQYSSRSGLIGILLPTYPRQNQETYDSHTVPPRLVDNLQCGFAKLYNWTNDPIAIQHWIHEAYLRRNTIEPDNSYPNFINNRYGSRW